MEIYFPISRDFSNNVKVSIFIIYKIKMKKYIDFNDIDIDETESSLTDKEFVKFLKDNNIYDKFIYDLQQDINMRKKKGHPYIEVNNFCNETDYLDYILGAFPWGNTPEGTDFWIRYNHKWVKYITDFFDHHH